MMRRCACRWLLLGAAALGGLAVGPGSAQAAEECQKFLEALRARGYFDVALEYLDQMRTSPLAGEDFKAAIDFEKAVTLKEGSRVERVAATREQQLAEARDAFAKFLADHADHPLANSARTQTADLLVERGRSKAEQAAGPNRSAQDKALLMEEARKLYQEAEKVVAELEKRFLEEHQKFPKLIDPKDTKQIEARDQVRRDLLQARLSLATVVYEIAKTYDPGSPDNKKYLREAAKKYDELYQKYDTLLAGLYARLWEGRCYKELGEADKAFQAFGDLLIQPDDPQPFRDLKAKTLVLFLETALLPAAKKYEQALSEVQKWQEGARGPEETSPEGLAIQYLAGEASFQQAKSLEAENKDAEKQRKLLAAARKHFETVAKSPGEYQDQARSALRRPGLAGETAALAEPANYAEARDRAKDILGRLQAPDLKPEEAAGLRQEAVNYFRMALRLRPPEIEAEEINIIRYYLAYLYYAAGQPYDAAVIGEFLARHYPGSAGARQAAYIAMMAYRMLYDEAPAQDRGFETEQMVQIAQYIAEQWPGEPEADEAWMMLIRTELGEGDLAKAQEYLGKIPADSPRRGEAELMTGQKLWATYVEAARKEEGQRLSQAELDQTVQHAQKTLQDGIERMRKAVDSGGPVTYTLVASVLSLAQIHIGAGEADQAVTWLRDPKIGALTLVEKNDPVTDRGNFRVETYKAALRALVATQQLDDAEKVIQSLEKLITQQGDPEASAKLTRIYIGLGFELQEQLERLRKEGKNEQLQKVLQGFETFLDRIYQREQGNTFNSLNWVAEAFLGLGAGFDTGGAKLPEEAKKYYTKAADTYKKILKLCEEKKIDCQSGVDTSVKVRLAQCLRRLANYSEALALLVGVLQKRATMIDAQVEAAYTYQAWGAQRPAAYKLAMLGGKEHREIWGWGQLAKRVHGHKQFESVFHEARYNLAVCRRKLAESRTGDDRKALLQQAENDIVVVQRLYPEMGGKQWYPKYDEELRKIQSLRGVSVTGLKGAGADPSEAKASAAVGKP